MKQLTNHEGGIQ